MNIFLRFLILSGVSGLAFGQISNVRVLGATATQAIVAYTAPDSGVCSLKVSETNDFSGAYAPIHDVDTALFANSDQDNRAGNFTNSKTRQFVVGQRTVSVGVNGKNYSRALQAFTTHYYQITCGAAIAAGNFSTSNIPFGSGYMDAPPLLGTYVAQETVDWNNPNAWRMIDPMTGTLHKLFTHAMTAHQYYTGGAFDRAVDLSNNNVCVSGVWTFTPTTGACGPLATGTAAVTNSTVAMFARPLLYDRYAQPNMFRGGRYRNWDSGLDQFQVSISAKSSSAAGGADNTIQIALSVDGVQPATAWVDKVLTSSYATYTAGLYTPRNTATDPINVDSWLTTATPPLNAHEAATRQGQVIPAVDAITLNYTGGGAAFNLNWSPNSHIVLDDGVHFVDCKIASITSPKQVILASNTCITGGGIIAPNGSTVLNYAAPNFGVLIRAKTANANTFTIQNPLTYSYAWSLSGYWPSTGYYDTFSANQYGGRYYAFTQGSGGSGHIYSFDPVAGTTNFIGPSFANGHYSGFNQWSNRACGNEIALFDNTKTGNLTIYCFGIETTTNKSVILQVTYSGPNTQESPGYDYVGGSGLGTAPCLYTDDWTVTCSGNNTVTKILTPVYSLTGTPVNKDLASLATAFDSTYDPVKFGNCTVYGVQMGKVLISCGQAQLQDVVNWLIVFDPGDGNPANAGLPGGPNVIGVSNTYNKSIKSCTNHASLPIGEAPYVTASGKTGAVTTSTTGGGPWLVKTTSDITSTGTACPASPWTTSGQLNCVTVVITAASGAVTGATVYDPYDPNPGTGETTNAGETVLAQVGDLFCASDNVADNCNAFVGSGSPETMRLVSRSGSTFILQRGIYPIGAKKAIGLPGDLSIKQLWETCQAITFDNTVYSGTIADGYIYWNWQTDPHGLNMLNDPGYYGSHGVYRPTTSVEQVNDGYDMGAGTGASSWYRVRQGVIPTIGSSVATYTVASPAFAGVSVSANTQSLQTHNSFPLSPLPNEKSAFFDNRPWLYGGSNAGFADSFTLVSGQLYKITGTIGASPDILINAPIRLNRKQQATVGACGMHGLKDVSSPATGNIIATDNTTQYQYCVVRASGECRTGSVIGEVYVNCPQLARTACWPNGILSGDNTDPTGTGNIPHDICLGNDFPYAFGVAQFRGEVTDPFGQYGRLLSRQTGQFKSQDGFSSSRQSPDGRWLLFNSPHLNMFRGEVLMMKLPPIPQQDSANRLTHIPFTLVLNPPASLGANNVIAEFGYAENGPTTNLFCTSRAETCVMGAGTTATNPFYFSGENPSGITAVSGKFTVTIPALPQHMLYYRYKYRTAANAVLTVSPIYVAAVP